MRSQQPDFGTYVRQTRGSRSLAEIEQNSARRGPRIAASYVNRIENGIARKPSADRLVALAHGLQRPISEVLLAAAGFPLSDADAQDEQLLTIFHELEEADRPVALDIVRTLAKSRRSEAGDVKQIKRGRRVA